MVVVPEYTALNRRYFGKEWFDRLVVAAVADTWYGKVRYNCG